MKKLLVVLLIIVGQFLCPSVQAQAESLHLTAPTTFLYEEGGMFIGDTLYMHNFRVIVRPKAMVRFNEIVGSGEIYIYEGAIFGLRGSLPSSVKVFIVDQEKAKEKDPIMQNG
jgi:hypothetical protein